MVFFLSSSVFFLLLFVCLGVSLHLLFLCVLKMWHYTSYFIHDYTHLHYDLDEAFFSFWLAICLCDLFLYFMFLLVSFAHTHISGSLPKKEQKRKKIKPQRKNGDYRSMVKQKKKKEFIACEWHTSLNVDGLWFTSSLRSLSPPFLYTVFWKLIFSFVNRLIWHKA